MPNINVISDSQRRTDGRTDAPAKEQSESHSRFDSFVQLVDRWVAETCANSLSPQLSASEHHTIFS